MFRLVEPVNFEDIGIAGGKGEGLVYKKGKPIGKVPEDKMLEFLMAEIERM